ncbi:MAG: TetR/AcrR family transcriptional regulator [Cytophagaceae bacterium]|nr:TetR/AcrR family transcriptional regulator [Cytophagaceae bacterium]
MEVKERIVKAAEELFFRLGVKSVTMDDVAKHLAISKKTIYQFFKDKDELVTSVTINHLENSQKSISEIADKAADPIDEVLKISEHIKIILQNVNPSLLFDINKFHPKAWQIFLDHKESCIHKSLEENLKKGIEKGLYRADIDVEILSILRLEEIQLAFNPFLFPPQKFQVQKVQLQFIEHFLYGICTLKGHKVINKYKQIQEED